MGVPVPSFSVWMSSTGRLSKRSLSPLVQRTSTASILVAAPRPKWMRISFFET